jgi:hypothetical protein
MKCIWKLSHDAKWYLLHGALYHLKLLQVAARHCANHTNLKTLCPPVDYRGVQNDYKTQGLSSAITVTVLFLFLFCLLEQW